MIWLAIIYAYKGVLLVFGLFLAWETRHVSIPALNDSKYIGMSVYNITIMCCLGVALSFVIQDNPAASHALVSIFILFCATITLSLVFVPKVIELRINPHANERIRVVGGLDKSRSVPGNAASITSSAKVRIIAEENTDLRKKLLESDKKLKELEDELYKLVPEEAPLLLKEDSESDIHTSPSKKNGGAKGVNLSPNSVYYHPSNTSNPSSQVDTKGPIITEDTEPSKELYENYGGVWIGPPGAADNPEPALISYDYSYDMNQNGSYQDSVAEVHRTYDDTVPLKTPDSSPVRFQGVVANNIPQSPYEMPAFLLQYSK